ncbi:HtaA domain-containing protein [Streptomyces sp. NPDC003877]
MRFLGHRTGTGEHQLDLTLSRPTVSVTGSTGTLLVDVTSKAKGTGAVTTSRQVPFASLSLGGIDMRGGGTTVVLNNVPATLTAQGARFPGATGRYDTDAGTLSASFEGSVTFKGHESDGRYGLDLTLAGLTATLDDGTGRLTADVTSLGAQSRDVVLAELKTDASDLVPEDGVITLDDVTATLTDAGAEAFGDFYTAGTRLDPVDLTVALTDDAQLPGGDGGTSGGTGGTSGGASGGTGTTGGAGTAGGAGSTTGGTTTGAVTGGLASTGSSVPAGPLGAAAAAAVVAGAGAVLAVCRRRTQA